MIEFRKKKPQDLMPVAMEYLNNEGIPFTIIAPEDANKVSKVNSKAMVLVSFIQNENGYYQIQVQDKELYNYTQKLLKDKFHMRITNIDKTNRVITAEPEINALGVILDYIDILGRKYNLSVVVQKKL